MEICLLLECFLVCSDMPHHLTSAVKNAKQFVSVSTKPALHSVLGFFLLSDPFLWKFAVIAINKLSVRAY